MKRPFLTRLREKGISSRIEQIVLVSPLFILWAGAIQFYETRSVGLLGTFFPVEWWTPILVIGLPAAAFLFTLYRMFRRAPEKLAWSLDILVCLFVGCSMLVLLGQILNV
jgi:glucan phosphoethanolaminetransferase (alkaline phosphatase superfamily)